MPNVTRMLVALAALAVAACTDDLTRPTGPSPGAPRALVVPSPGPYTQVSAGNGYTCALTTTGALECWGYGSAGRIDYPGPFAQVDAGAGSPCVIAEGDRNILCYDSGGTQLDPRTGPFEQVSVGGSPTSIAQHTCGLLETKAIVCWGSGKETHADGENYGQANPPPPGGPSPYGTYPTAWVQVSAGSVHTCALESVGGQVWCWGANTSGQLTGRTMTDVPPGVDPAKSNAIKATDAAVQVSAGGGHSCARRANGTVFCWGANSRGQLRGRSSTGTFGRDSLAGPFTDVSAGGEHTCAITKAQQSVRCWGSDEHGQVTGRAGALQDAMYDHPGPYAQVSAGARHTCALRTDGWIDCWGQSNGGNAFPPPPTTERVKPVATFVTPTWLGEGSIFKLELRDAQVPGYTEGAPFLYAFDCGRGYGAFGPSATASCTAGDGPGTVTVRGKVQDKGTDVSEDYTATIVISNVAPAITQLARTPYGGPLTLTPTGATSNVLVTWLDPGGDGPFGTVIECGNGTNATITKSEWNAVSGGIVGVCAYSRTDVGSRQLRAIITDTDGARGVRTGELRVVYPWLGFVAPLAAPPAINDAVPGSWLPVRFSLGGDFGPAILATGYPQAFAEPCPSGTMTATGTDDGDGIGPMAPLAATTGTLVYVAAAKFYAYVWQTDRSWTGTCRRLVIGLKDGSTHTVWFRFR